MTMCVNILSLSLYMYIYIYVYVSTGQQLQDQVARSPCPKSSAGKAREVFCSVAFWLASKHPPLLWEIY